MVVGRRTSDLCFLTNIFCIYLKIYSNILDPSGGRDVESEVLDVLQTRAEDAAKDNSELRAEVARLKREIERLRAGDCDRYSDLITLLPTDNPNPQWTSPLHRGSNRKNI